MITGSVVGRGVIAFNTLGNEKRAWKLWLFPAPLFSCPAPATDRATTYLLGCDHMMYHMPPLVS